MDLAALHLLRCPRSGQALALDEAVSGSRGSISFGILAAEGFSYPIVRGIPILRTEVDDVTDLVRAGCTHEATVVAALGDVDRSRLLPFVDSLAGLRGVGPAGRRIGHLLRRRQIRRDVQRCFGSPAGAELLADPLELLFLERRHPVAEGYNYFRFRFGTPRYLVSLALLDALPAIGGPVVDVGCGAGHLTWAITQRSGSHPVIGVDPSFAQLLTASALAPAATFVCADGRSLPLAEGGFDRVLSSDVLPYIAEKVSATRELVRVLSPEGCLVLTALRNSTQQHVHGGEPMTPAAWEALIAPLRHRRLLADDRILDHYLQRLAPGALDGMGVDESQSVSVVAGHRPPTMKSQRWSVWPHAVGPLRPHPLLERVGEDLDGTTYERRYPSETFAVDNRRIDDYLPARCTIRPDALAGAPAEQDDALQALIASVAVMGLPAGVGGHRGPHDRAAEPRTT